MKKQILNLGKALSKKEQKNVFGGYQAECYEDLDCGPDMWCTNRNVCRAICNGEYCTHSTSCEYPNGPTNYGCGPY